MLPEVRRADFKNVSVPRLKLSQDFWYLAGIGKGCFACSSEKKELNGEADRKYVNNLWTALVPFGLQESKCRK